MTKAVNREQSNILDRFNINLNEVLEKKIDFDSQPPGTKYTKNSALGQQKYNSVMLRLEHFPPTRKYSQSIY